MENFFVSFIAFSMLISCTARSGDSVVIDVGTRDIQNESGNNTDAVINRDTNNGGGDLRGEVEAIITSDNGYAFGWGEEDRLANYFRTNMTSSLASEIFSCPVGGPNGVPSGGLGPERFLIPANDTGAGKFLYVVAWADETATQGTLGQFKRVDGMGNTVYTGIGPWEVCATGVDHNSGPGPTQASVDAELVRCNAGSGSPATTSAGWVAADRAVTPTAVGRLATGEDNSVDGRPTENFPVTCQMDANGYGINAQARWMWYNPDPATINNPFRARNTKKFLIFRLPLSEEIFLPG